MAAPDDGLRVQYYESESDSDDDRHNYDFGTSEPEPMERLPYTRPPTFAGVSFDTLPVYQPDPNAPAPGPWSMISAPEPPPKPRYDYTLVDGVWKETLLPEDQWIPADPRRIKYKHIPPNMHSESVRKFIAESNLPQDWLERDSTRAPYRQPTVGAGGAGTGPAYQAPHSFGAPTASGPGAGAAAGDGAMGFDDGSSGMDLG
eukprot:c15177_g1_i1.p1 GENE.c15177_g1_i1~~c15177_g1_i1.p1  ORF type:complete len:202 (-),score=19.67 c15177_g1_i1:31-636(-)